MTDTYPKDCAGCGKKIKTSDFVWFEKEFSNVAESARAWHAACRTCVMVGHKHSPTFDGCARCRLPLAELAEPVRWADGTSQQ